MGIVYVLTNPVMPGLVKIGRTERADVNRRLMELYSTGVPVPFDLAFAGNVDDGQAVEAALHVAFGPYRINPSREFFRIEPDQAIAILKLLNIEDETPEVASEPSGIDAESRAAAEQQRRRRPTLNFDQMGIPAGSELKSTVNDVAVTVVSARKVRLGDEEMYITEATQRALGTDYPVNPGPRWTFNGRVLREIYEEIYGDA